MGNLRKMCNCIRLSGAIIGLVSVPGELNDLVSIKVIFDVEDAVGGANVGGTCRMWPEEPIVTLSLTE